MGVSNARGQAERLQKFRRPVPRARIGHLRGGRNGVFRPLFPREKIGQKIRHKQQRPRLLQGYVAVAAQGQQLVERIERHERQPRMREYLLPGHHGIRRLRHPLGAPVAVMHRVSQQHAVSVQQSEVYAPGIQSDGRGRDARLRRLLQALRIWSYSRRISQ